jgi:hypothetical protein
MTIKNDVQLKADSDAIFADNAAGGIIPSNHRQFNDDMLDSVRPYSGVITGGAVSGYTITETPAILSTFDASPITTNALFQGDFANSHIDVFSACNVFATVKINGEWSTQEDLKIEIYVNDVPNPITDVSFTQKGEGTGNPISISSANNLFVITQAMVDAGGGAAKVSIYASNAAVGSFDLEQIEVTLWIQYVAFSIS